MNRLVLGLCAVLIVTTVALSGCSRESAVDLPEMASVTAVKDTDLNQIVLTDVAFNNLGIQTEAVRAETGQSSAGTPRRLVIPASALIFDSQGNPYAYTSPAPKTYVRALVVVSEYRGNDVYLTAGPPVGTQIVTVGDPELLGIEYGVGAE
jgi:hypothetical protein